MILLESVGVNQDGRLDPSGAGPLLARASAMTLERFPRE
jgi:hypothetical protein